MWNDRRIKLEAVGGEDPIVFVPPERVLQFGWDIAPSQIQPASLDVRLGPDLTEAKGDLYRVELTNRFPKYRWHFAPGATALGALVERMKVPADVVARVEGKSSLARRFLTVHSAGFIDPGFTGDVTLELKNDGHDVLYLYPGQLIAQISFQSLDAPADRPYGHPGLHSHYQGQTGPTEAR